MSAQKNVPLLLDFLTRYEAEHPGRFTCLFLGEGEVRVPAQGPFQFVGRVGEERKRELLANAHALVQLLGR